VTNPGSSDSSQVQGYHSVQRRLVHLQHTEQLIQPRRLLDVLEALYAWESSAPEWIANIVHSLTGFWNRRGWTVGFVYDAADPRRFKTEHVTFANAPDRVKDLMTKGLAAPPPGFVVRTFRTMSIGFGRSIAAEVGPFFREMERHGTFDIFGINGRDPIGLGCFVGFGVPSGTSLASDELVIFDRIAAHLSSAHRCRKRIQSTAAAFGSPEALAPPHRRSVERNGAAKAEPPHRAIGRPILSMQQLKPRREADTAGSWRRSVATRWTLIDAAAEGGRNYVVDRENELTAAGLQLLTPRERQVAASIAVGRSTKEVAYDLGISSSTVRVLLTRLYARLGVSSRREFLSLPAVKSLRGALKLD
jgi:DNA-binding CsgD family transcriptional regulator